MIDGPTERQATTSSGGLVTLNALPVGTYGVRITRSGYEPVGTSIRVGSGYEGPKFVSVRLEDTSFADVRQPTAVASGAAVGDPVGAHALAALPTVDLVPGELGAGIALEGTSPDESRVELDGVPLAGGASGPAAVRFRDGLMLDRIAVAEGPFVESTSLRDAIGGLVDYRTPDISQTPSSEAAVGHDADFGTFEHVRFSDTFGPLGFLGDAVTGGGTNTAQTAKVRYALAPGTTLGFASYGSQSSAVTGASDYANLAPAYAADLRAKLGGTIFEARAFDSVSDTSVVTAGVGSFGEDARIHGFQLGFDIPAGSDVVSVSFDRRRESATFQSGGSYDETFSTLAARGDFAVSGDSRLELGGAWSSGTDLAKRFDPEALFTFRPSPSLTLRFAAGSGFATAPDAVLGATSESGALAASAASVLRSPETSFGYRASVEVPLRGKSRVWAAAYELRRFDRFASLADARSLAAQAGLDVPASPGGFGGTAFVELAKTYAYGPPQPFLRYADLDPLVPLAQLDGDPYAKARLALTYRSTAGFDVSAGTTLLGAGNALADHAVVLGDASLRVSFGKIGYVTLGVSNAFGTTVTNPALAPLYAPRELTLTLGH